MQLGPDCDGLRKLFHDGLASWMILMVFVSAILEALAALPVLLLRLYDGLTAVL